MHTERFARPTGYIGGIPVFELSLTAHDRIALMATAQKHAAEMGLTQEEWDEYRRGHETGADMHMAYAPERTLAKVREAQAQSRAVAVA